MTSASGKDTTVGLAPMGTDPPTAVLVGVALAWSPMVARAVDRFMRVLAYPDEPLVKRGQEAPSISNVKVSSPLEVSGSS